MVSDEEDVNKVDKHGYTPKKSKAKSEDGHDGGDGDDGITA